MKIAGQKTDGAWFRTNKAIQKLDDDERQTLATQIAASDYIHAAYNALTGLIASTGLTGIPHAASVLEWAQSFCDDGIPRQIWMGKLTWDTYTKQETGGTFGKKGHQYVQDHAFPIREFGQDLRDKCKRYFMARRQIKDLFNSGTRAEGNPSGLPDTNKNT